MAHAPCLLAGVQARRPLRPWEQQQQQQQDDEALQRQSLLRQALAAVLAALHEAAAPTAAGGADSSAVCVLLPVMAPAVAFLASAMPALAGAHHALASAAAGEQVTWGNSNVPASAAMWLCVMPYVWVAHGLPTVDRDLPATPYLVWSCCRNGSNHEGSLIVS
jgi:hypothetical protein